MKTTLTLLLIALLPSLSWAQGADAVSLSRLPLQEIIFGGPKGIEFHFVNSDPSTVTAAQMTVIENQAAKWEQFLTEDRLREVSPEPGDKILYQNDAGAYVTAPMPPIQGNRIVVFVKTYYEAPSPLPADVSTLPLNLWPEVAHISKTAATTEGGFFTTMDYNRRGKVLPDGVSLGVEFPYFPAICILGINRWYQTLDPQYQPHWSATQDSDLAPKQKDMQAVILHELGHALGLASGTTTSGGYRNWSLQLQAHTDDNGVPYESFMGPTVEPYLPLGVILTPNPNDGHIDTTQGGQFPDGAWSRSAFDYDKSVPCLMINGGGAPPGTVGQGIDLMSLFMLNDMGYKVKVSGFLNPEIQAENEAATFHVSESATFSTGGVSVAP